MAENELTVSHSEGSLERCSLRWTAHCCHVPQGAQGPRSTYLWVGPGHDWGRDLYFHGALGENPGVTGACDAPIGPWVRTQVSLGPVTLPSGPG